MKANRWQKAIIAAALLIGGSVAYTTFDNDGGTVEELRGKPRRTTTTVVPSTSSTSVVSTTTTTTPPTTRRTFYVDAVAGSDSNDGRSPATAWRTMPKATSAVLQPSDWLLLKRGSVWNQQLRLDESGTSSQPIEVGAYGTGADPVIDGENYLGTCLLVNGSHTWISHLRLERCLWAGVDIYGDQNLFTESYVTGNAAGVVLRQPATYNKVYRSQVIDNRRMSQLTVGGDDDSGAFGFLIQGDYNEIAFNEVRGHYAFSHDYGQDGGAFEIFGGIGNRIHRNLAIDNDSFSELGDPRTHSNYLYYNVVRGSLPGQIFFNTRGELNSWGPTLNSHLYNNSVYLPGEGSQGVLCYQVCSPELLTMRNNIIYTTYKVGSMDGPCACSNNVFWGSQIQFTKAPTDIVADPLFVSATDLRLRAGSPAIDNGYSLSYYLDFDNLSFVGQVDRGAYEYRG